MNDYHREQLDALDLVRDGLNRLPSDERTALEETLSAYRMFRARVDRFQERYVATLCTENCFRSRRSACCSREGIITFFADVVINALLAPADALDQMAAVLARPNTGFKCVYLGDAGCLWHIKPIVCAMFLCDSAKRAVFESHPEAQGLWEALEMERNRFTWPDRPVLFDALEQHFLSAGRHSPLMYLNTSPGLLRVKQRAASTRNPAR